MFILAPMELRLSGFFEIHKMPILKTVCKILLVYIASVSSIKLVATIGKTFFAGQRNWWSGMESWVLYALLTNPISFLVQDLSKGKRKKANGLHRLIYETSSFLPTRRVIG